MIDSKLSDEQNTVAAIFNFMLIWLVCVNIYKSSNALKIRMISLLASLVDSLCAKFPRGPAEVYFFQASAPFCSKNAKFWLILAIVGYFVTNLSTVPLLQA